MAKRQIEIVEIDNTGRPIADSANGKLNAFSHYCDHVMHSKNYAVCLHLIDERKTGRLETLYVDCSVAIGKKRCPAIAMHKEEVEAGHAIYFRERIKTLGESFMESATELMNSVKDLVKSPVTKKEDNKGLIQPDVGSYADAINSASKKKEVEKKTDPLPAVQGESLLEIAKRMMLANQ